VPRSLVGRRVAHHRGVCIGAFVWVLRSDLPRGVHNDPNSWGYGRILCIGKGELGGIELVKYIGVLLINFYVQSRKLLRTMKI